MADIWMPPPESGKSASTTRLRYSLATGELGRTADVEGTEGELEYESSSSISGGGFDVAGSTSLKPSGAADEGVPCRDTVRGTTRFLLFRAILQGGFFDGFLVLLYEE